MSYEVTATRRRPQQFDDLVGQEFVAETLKNSIKTGKIAHAYLFAGPRGCGKTSTARILAKALNCQEGPADKPCGKCSNCLEITKGSSLDVIEIDGASNTSVENIRQIKDEVMFPPANSRYKIYIIDEVHMLSTSAFNALLKTIEEPPEYVIFIFATTELQKVPATIKSRCQQYNFRLVSVEKVKTCLAEAAAELGIQADDEALFWVARESTGSMRDAYTLFDQVVAFSDGHITYEKIRDKLGLVGVERLNSIFEACVAGKTEQVLSVLDEFLQAGVSIEQIISNSADYLRSLLLIKSGITKESLLGNSVERYSSEVLKVWNTVQIERALSLYLQLYRDIRYSLSPRYELELAFSRLCWLKDYVSSAEVKKAIDAAHGLLMNGTAPKGEMAYNQMPANQMSSSQMASVQASENTVSNSSENVSQPIPNGLPRLSGLNAEEDSEPENPEENGPFLNGGPLPPEQSVGQTSEQNNNSENEPKVIDERLKLHIPEANITSEGIVPSAYIPTASSPSEYTLNPDSEEDWSDAATPPEDESNPTQDYEFVQEQVEQTYEAYANAEDKMFSSVSNQAQLNETFTTNDGRTMSVAQLKGNVMATLAVSDGFVATTLDKTGDWHIGSDSVDTTVDSSYNFSLLQKNIQTISKEISRVCGKPMSFNVKLQQNQQEKTAVEIPEQVKILLDVFRGNIVTGKH
ncbi:MAG: DNA polymerase III subunit gamma/tau [Treponema sp.]|nr:DNA polymerase III subunit gamma/tau [Treponema sp.]